MFLDVRETTYCLLSWHKDKVINIKTINASNDVSDTRCVVYIIGSKKTGKSLGLDKCCGWSYKHSWYVMNQLPWPSNDTSLKHSVEAGFCYWKQ